jgi:DNA cross-link repair 1B protein
MDANHIIGSVMILFKGYFGSILHTGDMRWSRKLLQDSHPLFNSDATMKVKVDELILDNTYCDPIFNFPAQVSSTVLLGWLINDRKSV